MSKIELDDEAIRQAFVTQILEQISEVKRDEIINRAAENIIRTDLSNFRQRGTDYDAYQLRQAITNMVVECMKERLETAENKKRIADACQQAIDGVSEKLAEKVAEAFTNAVSRVMEGWS